MIDMLPVAGSPPTLEWIALDRLSIDTQYQRSADSGRSITLIRQITRAWDWRVYQPLSVARRADGALYVVDGQHRLAAARQRGDITHLPVVITSFVDVAEEAAAFESMNRQRKSMSRLERYRAAAVAGDPTTVAALDAIRCAGLKLARHETTDKWKPGEFAGIAAVVNGIKQHGRKVVEAALCALGEGFADEPLTSGGMLFQGLLKIYAKPPADFDPDLLIEVLGDMTQQEWVERGRMTAAASGFTQKITDGIASAMLARAEKLAARRAA